VLFGFCDPIVNLWRENVESLLRVLGTVSDAEKAGTKLKIFTLPPYFHTTTAADIAHNGKGNQKRKTRCFYIK